MGSEIALPVLGPIVLIGIAILIVAAISGRRRQISERSFLGLGRTRIASGYLGSLVAVVPVAFLMARDDACFQVANHYITAEAAARYQPKWTLEFYFMTATFTIVLITIIGLPTLALLRKIKMASAVGITGACLVIVTILSFWLNSISAQDIGVIAAVTACFALAARLPWIQSPALGSGRSNDDTHPPDTI